MKESVKQWIELAERDLQAADVLGQVKLYPEACFHCQQAVEKALKALLLHKKGTFPKTHSLRELADKAGVFDELKESIAFLEADYSATRYVLIEGQPNAKTYTQEKYEQRKASAQNTLEKIKQWIND